MDFFHTKTDSTITPSTLNYFAIYDPSLSVSEDDTVEQLLLFLSNTEDGVEITDNEKLRKIGLIQGIKEFSSNYDDDYDDDDDAQQGEDLDWIELDNCQILFLNFENRYNFILAISLTKIEDDGVIEYQDNYNSPSILLRELINQGYDEFRLHNGSIESLFESMEKDQFIEYLTKWWSVWFKNFQLGLQEDGLLKLFKGYQRSGLRIDSEMVYNIDKINVRHGFKELLIFNNDETHHENYGLVYEYSKTLEDESKYSLLNWFQTVDYFGLTTENLVSSNIIKLSQTPELETESNTPEFVYDPFKLVFNTITDVSKASGITHGLTTSVNTVTSGIQTVNSYMPWFKQAQEVPVDNSEDDVLSRPKDLDFLVGKHDEFISYKNLYLDFKEEGEKLNRLVIFKYFKFHFILIYDFKNNLLNELEYYDELFKDLSNLGKIHLNRLIKDPAPKRNFYFIGYDQNTNIIETNLPNIPLRDDSTHSESISDTQYFNDLSVSKTQSSIIHKQIIKILKTPSADDNFEQLTRSRNGWWIYNVIKQGKQVFIIKKWKTMNGQESGKILESSTSVIDIIGKNGKLWLDNYIS